MTYPKVCLRRGEETGVRAGKPWIFENQLDWADDVCKDGGIVDVLDSRMRFAARGYFNSKSKITVRVLTRDESETIDRDFFRRRIERAWSVRRMLGFENSCRVVFGESDGLPGLTVDKFADCLSFQIVSLGMERWKDDIVAILAELFQPQGIYERDDVAVREKEGLPQIKECVYGTVPEEIEIREHDARMLVSIENGQKTGHFLDQQENRGRSFRITSSTARATPPAAAKPRPRPVPFFNSSSGSIVSRSTFFASKIPISSSYVRTKSTSLRSSSCMASSFFAAHGPTKTTLQPGCCSFTIRAV